MNKSINVGDYVRIREQILPACSTCEIPSLYEVMEVCGDNVRLRLLFNGRIEFYRNTRTEFIEVVEGARESFQLLDYLVGFSNYLTDCATKKLEKK